MWLFLALWALLIQTNKANKQPPYFCCYRNARVSTQEGLRDPRRHWTAEQWSTSLWRKPQSSRFESSCFTWHGFMPLIWLIPLQEGHASSSTDPSPPALGAAVMLEEAGCCRCPQDTLLPLKDMFSAQIQPGIYCSAWEEVAGGSPSCANSFLATGDVSNTPFPLGMWFAWHNETLSVYQGGRRWCVPSVYPKASRSYRSQVW